MIDSNNLAGQFKETSSNESEKERSLKQVRSVVEVFWSARQYLIENGACEYSRDDDTDDACLCFGDDCAYCRMSRAVSECLNLGIE